MEPVLKRPVYIIMHDLEDEKDKNWGSCMAVTMDHDAISLWISSNSMITKERKQNGKKESKRA